MSPLLNVTCSLRPFLTLTAMERSECWLAVYKPIKRTSGPTGLGDIKPLGNRIRSELLKRLVFVQVPLRYKLPAFLSARIVRYIDNSAIDPVARGQRSWLVYGVKNTRSWDSALIRKLRLDCSFGGRARPQSG